jgi:hypothetical protein
MATTVQPFGVQQRGRPPPAPQRRIALIVATSLAAGLVLAAALVAAPFNPRNRMFSPVCLHRVAHATTHASLLDDEPDPAAGSQAVRDVVASVRTSRPLPGR